MTMRNGTGSRLRGGSKRAALQRGVTLVELMVAMLLGLVLTAGAIQVFIGNRATYEFNDGLARLQENGRFAVNTLNYRSRMAGYFGCLPNVPINNYLAGAGSLAFNFAQGLMGYEAVGTAPGATFAAMGKDPTPSANGADWTSALPADLVGSVVPGSDVIVIYNVGASSHALVSPYNQSGQIFADATPSDYTEGEIGIVSDCQKATVFQITSVSENTGTGSFGIDLTHSTASFVPGNSTPVWVEAYGEGAELLRAETWIYYVGARNGNGPPALFQQRLSLTGVTVDLVAEELVEGVDTMQVLYGVDDGLDGAVDGYVTANAVTDWTEVVAVRFGLLLRSPDEYGSEIDDQTYDVNGTTFDPVDDRRTRQVFTTTVALRNRLP